MDSSSLQPQPEYSSTADNLNQDRATQESANQINPALESDGDRDSGDPTLTEPPNSLSLGFQRSAQVIQRLLRPLWHLSKQQWAWISVAALLTGGASVQAMRLLLEVPELPDCWTVYLSHHSASAQLYCAETIASKRTIESIRKAIALVEQLPPENGLRDKGEQLTHQWALELLRLAEDTFQAGDLERALYGARSVPSRSPVYLTATERIQQWQATWDKAELLYQEAAAQIEQKRWSEAINIARGLLQLGNAYWETTKYQELVEQLELARGNQNPNNKSAANRKNSQVSRISGAESYLSQIRQTEAATIAVRLDKAYGLARSGDLAGLRAAVAEAEQVMYSSARFEEVQQAIRTWKQQIEAIEDRPHLDRAIAIASKGDANSLQMAIDEAYQIYAGRALYSEARNRIDQWSTRMYTLQKQAMDQEIQELSQPSQTPNFAPPTTAPIPTSVSNPLPPTLSPTEANR